MFTIRTTSITCATPDDLAEATELRLTFPSDTLFTLSGIVVLELKDAPALGIWGVLGHLLLAPWGRTIIDFYDEYRLRIGRLRGHRVRIEELYSESSFELLETEFVNAYRRWTGHLMTDLTRQWPTLLANPTFIRLRAGSDWSKP